MEHLLSRDWWDLLGRADGFMTFRLILQPVMATLLALRTGWKDARAGRAPFGWAVVSDPAHRRYLLRQGWQDVGRVFVLALVLDVIYQVLVLHWVYPGELLVVATLLALVPYLIVRGPANRIAAHLHTGQHQERPLSLEPNASTPARRGSLPKRLVILTSGVLLTYLAAAYLLLPALWERYAHRHPSLEDIRGITHSADGIPGDPINVSLIGTKAEVIKIMLAAKWYPADPITLRSSLAIAVDAVFKRPDDEAPVSNLYLFGRKQDLAFEQQVDDNPRKRHHVRFWQTDKVDPDGRPVWVGSAIYDERVGLSRLTGQITHVTGPDIDAERDKLFHDLEQTGDLAEVIVVKGFHKVLEGRNGGGDPWHTDGNLYEGVIKPTGSQSNP
jgi:hypothetical protein